MISFTTIGRNDDYGKNFINRFYTSVSKNLENIAKFNIPFEYLIIEWNPIKEYLIYEEHFKSLFENNENLIDVIVTPEVSIKEGLNPKIYYEYFAKNVGIRLSKYDSLILLNSDIVIPETMMKLYIDIIKEGLDEMSYYKPITRTAVNYSLQSLSKYDVNSGGREDSSYSGDWPGDIFMMSKSGLIKYGQGYDETNPVHRTITQSAMDTELMINLHLNNCKCVWIPTEYYHINHEYNLPRDVTGGKGHKTNGYNNKSNWGFIDYEKEIINKNLIIIK